MKTAFNSIITIALLALTSLSASAQLSVAQTWGFDKTHSQIKFAVTHLVISEVEGEFTSFEGKVVSESEDFSGASVEFSAQVSSIDTENEQRDGHLQSPDFFNAAEYPTLSFVSSSFEKKSGNKYELKGELTMHGVTKPITLDVTYGGTVKDPYGNTKAGFKLRGELSRFEYGLKWDAATEAGNLVVSEEVEIIGNIQLVLQK